MGSSVTPIHSRALSAWVVFRVEGSDKPLVEIKAYGSDHATLKADAIRQIKACIESKQKFELLDDVTVYQDVMVCGTVPPGNTEFCLLVRFSGTIHDIVEAAGPQLERLFKQLPQLAEKDVDPHHLTLLRRVIDNATTVDEAQAWLTERRLGNKARTRKLATGR